MTRLKIGEHNPDITFHTSPPGARREYVDRSDAPDGQFAPLLARLEAADTIDAGQDARVETVARAMWDVIAVRSAGVREPEPWGRLGSHTQDTYRDMATAALAAMHPAHEVERIADERAAEALKSAAASAPVMTFDNGYPVRAVPVADLLGFAASLRAASRGETEL